MKLLPSWLTSFPVDLSELKKNYKNVNVDGGYTNFLFVGI